MEITGCVRIGLHWKRNLANDTVVNGFPSAPDLGNRMGLYEEKGWEYGF